VPGRLNSELDRDSPAHESGGENAADSSFSPYRVLETTLGRAAVWTQASQAYGLALWGLACLGGFMTLAFSLHGMNRLLHDSVAAEERVVARAEQLARTLRLRLIPSVRVHRTLDQPCLCGILQPAIILPEPWLSTAEPAMLDAVLAHELAHSKRLDPLWNGLQRVLDTVLFFHPGVGWLSRSLRREREIAADSLAVQITGDPLALALALESVARLCAGRRVLRHAGAAFGGEYPTLLPRIQELLGMTPAHTRFRSWPFAALASAVVVALVTATVGLAHDEPTQRHQAQPPAPESLVFSIACEEWSRQISYEIRFIETEPDIWRHALEGKLKHLANRGKTGRWIVDGKDAFEQLIRWVMVQPRSRMSTAPKPTTYESLHLVIKADAGPDGQSQPGTTITLSGTWLPAATRMSLELTDSGNASPRQEPAAKTENGEVRLQDSVDIPDGSSLVLSLGRVRRFIENRHVTSERLIVIMPSRLQIAAEVVRQPAAVKP